MPLDTWASKSKICLSKGLNSSYPLLSLALVMLKLYSMTIRAIVIHGDPVLHNPTDPVTEPIDSPELQTLIADMYETMAAAHGVGLAANQVGIGKRLVVYDCPDEIGRAHV